MSRIDGYAPIGDYALIGNRQGCALVALDGSVDWLAVPVVDTPPLLAGLLDAEEGGHFVVQPVGEFISRRNYLPATMVLETIFETESGNLKVTDSMNVGFRGPLPWTELCRKVEVTAGRVPVRWQIRPGSRLARHRPWVHRRDGIPFILDGDLLAAVITDEFGEAEIHHRWAEGTVELEAGRPALVSLAVNRSTPLMVPSPQNILSRLDHTIEYWKGWSAQIDYQGPHEEHVRRSVLTIAALGNIHTGALAAAPTTSLPEVLGKERNYDYRYGWVRDASFMMDSFARVELGEETDASLRWLLAAVSRTAPDIHVFYKINGEPAPAEERKIEVLDGYRGTGPVTEGNKAASQRQVGSYGYLFGAATRHVDHGARLDTETALMLSRLADRACDEWPLPGAGIWELGEQRNYTSSLINSWAALHSAVNLVERGEMPDTHVERWREAREEVHRWTDEHCWSEAKQAYTFYAGSDDLDASVLLAARTGFCRGDDPRLWTTIDAIRRELTADGPWLYRYTGASEQEHAFVCCTFWLIEALCHAGRTAEAGDLLDGALAGSNDVLLWSEEKVPGTGELMGNFPLGLSHLAVVGAVCAYAEATSRDDL